jgi:hypothetical protein
MDELGSFATIAAIEGMMGKRSRLPAEKSEGCKHAVMSTAEGNV